MPRKSPTKSYKSRDIPRSQKTTTKEGFNEYMKEYMRIKRAEQKLCQIDLAKAVGLQTKRIKKESPILR